MVSKKVDERVDGPIPPEYENAKQQQLADTAGYIRDAAKRVSAASEMLLRLDLPIGIYEAASEMANTVRRKGSDLADFYEWMARDPRVK